MSFVSLTFGGFIFVVLALLALTALPIFGSNEKSVANIRHWILLIASYVFCGWFDWRFCIAIFGISVVAYFAALNVDRGRSVKANFYFGLLVPIAALAVFKYYHFFLDSVSRAFSIDPGSLGALKIILPVGISFYTFQAISYIVDVYRKKISASPSFVKVALYMAFFPRLIAGPVVRAGFFLPQLDENRNVSLKNLEAGLQIFLIGLFKKIVVADRLTPFVDQVYATPNAFHGAVVALAVASYALQIYFDFSGYSDMAIGTARALGYNLPKNFDFPHMSRSPSEFWKRWHISLSSWLMDYIYIPLGGNRKGRVRTYFNLLATMLIGGLWHGAGWTYVAWGGLHGLALCAHRFVREIGSSKSNRGDKSSVSSNAPSGSFATIFIGQLLSILGTFVWIAICLIPFRAESFSHAKEIFLRMFVWNNGVFYIYIWTLLYAALLVVVSLIAAYKYLRRLRAAEKSGVQEEIDKVRKGWVALDYPILDLSKASSLFIVSLFVYLILAIAYIGTNQFVYIQF